MESLNGDCVSKDSRSKRFNTDNHKKSVNVKQDYALYHKLEKKEKQREEQRIRD